MEWAEFGPVELDERLLIQPRVHTMVSDAQCSGYHVQMSLYNSFYTSCCSCIAVRLRRARWYAGC